MSAPKRISEPRKMSRELPAADVAGRLEEITQARIDADREQGRQANAADRAGGAPVHLRVEVRRKERVPELLTETEEQDRDQYDPDCSIQREQGTANEGPS